MLDSAKPALAALPDAVLGIAPHSLRAVTGEELGALLPLTDGPVHIHIAEQVREVEACLAWSGQLPVQWLYNHAPVDARWCLVHATHITDDERAAIVASRAVAGLCPITEANLGDGLFPMQAFAREGGRFGIGSDSNVLINAVRAAPARIRPAPDPARSQRAGAGCHPQHRSLPVRRCTARWRTGAGRGGWPAGGRQCRSGRTGCRTPALQARQDDAWLDSWVFAARNGALRSVWRHGRHCVAEGRHLQREAITTAFAAALKGVLG